MNLSAINKATENKTRTTGISPFSELRLEQVYPNPAQPRKSFENIEELANSIVENGLIQPISVVKKEDGYMIIGGERRYRASLHAKLTTIKAHILQVDDKKVLELSLVENIQRDDLTDFEKAQFIAELWASGNYAKKQDLAEAISKSSSYISKALGTLKLDDEIMADIKESKQNIGLSVLEEIARVPDKTTQKEVYEKIKSKEITRDDIKEFKSEKVSPRDRRAKKELAFDENGADFEKIKEDLKNTIIFHAMSSVFKLTNIKSYKMYRITIEEV
jgi:ParB family chromosome partitioning protein